MPLDRHAKRLLEMIATGRHEQGHVPSPELLRRSMMQLADVAEVRGIPIHMENRGVPGPGGDLPIRIYTPCDATSDRLPCIVYFHGGTGVFCGIDTHDGLCRM